MRFIDMTVSGFESAAEEVYVDFSSPSLLFRGTNGSGKSMLAVWAPIFALFGQTRGRTITDSVSTFSSQAKVELVFEMGGETYKIIRKLPRKGRQEATLFALIDEEWKALTEKEVRSTNEKIVDVLGMGYATSQATWIAEQGKYGTLTEARPAERRKILANILSLDYEPMHAKFTTLAKDASTRIYGTQAQLEEMDALRDTLSRELNPAYANKDDEELEEGIAEAEARIEELTKASGAGEAEITRARQAVSFAQREIEAHKGQLEQAIERARQSFEETKARLNDGSVERAKAALERAESARIQQESARAREKELASLIRSHDEKLHDVAQAMNEIAQAAPAQADKVNDLEAALERIQEEANKILAGKEPINAQIAQIQARISAQRAHIDAADSQEARLNESLAHGGTQCYACTQPLDDDLLATVRANLEDKRAHARHEIDALSKDIDAHTGDLAAIDERVNDKRAQYTETLTQKKNIEAEIAQARTQLDALRQTQRDIEAVRSEHIMESARISGQLAELETLVSSTQDYRAAYDEALTTQSATRRQLEERQRAYDDALKQETPHELLENLAVAQHELARAEGNTSEKTQEEVFALRESVNAMSAELTTRSHARQREAQLDTREAQLKDVLASQEQEGAEYDLLRQAFAPTGIPSMIMAGVVGELETLTNEYLDRFSNGAMSILVDTQRETQSGKVNEEIYISVAMPDGVREYSTLSGGQQFRVNLALRIALSKISASRRGSAMIETLIVDEGFGALDEEGISAAVGALRDLSQEVNVIAVSHVSEVVSGFEDVAEVSLLEGTTTVEQVQEG